MILYKQESWRIIQKQESWRIITYFGAESLFMTSSWVPVRVGLEKKIFIIANETQVWMRKKSTKCIWQKRLPCCFAFLNFEGIFKLLVYKISNNHDWQLLILKYCINTNPYKNIQTFIKYCHCDNFPYQGHKTTIILYQRESKIIV